MLNDNLRVALVTPNLNVGGAERLLVELVSSWRELDKCVQPCVYSFKDGPIRSDLQRIGCLVSLYPVLYRINPLTIRWLANVLRRDRIQVVHLHLPLAGFYGRLAARLLNLPILYTEHNVWEVYNSFSRFINKATYFLNTHVVAVSNEVLRSIIRNSKYPMNKITRIYNGIRPMPDFYRKTYKKMRQRLGLCDNGFILGCIANLHWRKGHRFLLEALHKLVNKHQEVQCVFIGRDDGEGPLLYRLADKLGIKHHVHWLGYRPDARELLFALDVFVIPSLYEGLPVAIIEAMDAGLPVIATRVGGNPELVIHGETGFLVEPGNAEELAIAISSLMADPIKRFQMGEAAKIRMRKEFTADQMGKKYFELYNSLIN